MIHSLLPCRSVCWSYIVTFLPLVLAVGIWHSSQCTQRVKETINQSITETNSLHDFRINAYVEGNIKETALTLFSKKQTTQKCD